MGEWRLRRPGHALEFDGTDDYVDYGTGLNTTFNGGGEITASAFVKADTFKSSGNQGIICEDYNPSANNVTFVILHHSSSGEWRTGFFDGNWHRAATPRTQSPGETIHIAGTYDGSTIRLYIDGEEVDSLSYNGGLPAGDEIWTSGRRWDKHANSDSYWSGTIDRPQIHNRALSASEISTLADGGSVTDGLVSLWEYDDGSGTTATDSVGSNDGTLNGPAWTGGITLSNAETTIFGGELSDAYNRFARSALVEIPSRGGSEVSNYPSFTPVALDVKLSDGSWYTRLGGFVTNPTTKDNSLELEVLSHDLWLRRRDVYESYSGATIAAIIEDLVTQYTPLEWDPSRVSVVNNETLTRQWKGEKPAAILQELSNASAGEEFGADNSGTFYFRPTETETSPRHFTQGEYTGADFDDDGKSEVNKVTVYYGQGSSSGGVSVQDRSSQKELQDELGAPRPVVIEETASHPEISSEAAAERKARAILNGNVGIRTGTIQSWGAYQVNPGDVARVDVPDQDVNGDYRVAEITYDLTGGTEVRLAENAEGVTDVLVDMSQEVSRVDAKTSDTSASLLEVLPLTQDIAVETEIEIFTYSVPADQFQMGDFKGGFGDPSLASGSFTVDDAEDGDVSEYSGNTGNLAIGSTDTISGDHDLEHTTAGDGKYVVYSNEGSGLPHYPGNGETIEFDFRVVDANDVPIFMYGLNDDPTNHTANTGGFALEMRPAGEIWVYENGSQIKTVTGTYPTVGADASLSVRVQGNTHIVTILDGDGTVLFSFSFDASRWYGQGVGFGHDNSGSASTTMKFDNIASERDASGGKLGDQRGDKTQVI